MAENILAQSLMLKATGQRVVPLWTELVQRGHETGDDGKTRPKFIQYVACHVPTRRKKPPHRHLQVIRQERLTKVAERSA